MFLELCQEWEDWHTRTKYNGNNCYHKKHILKSKNISIKKLKYFSFRFFELDDHKMNNFTTIKYNNNDYVVCNIIYNCSFCSR